MTNMITPILNEDKLNQWRGAAARALTRPTKRDNYFLGIVQTVTGIIHFHSLIHVFKYIGLADWHKKFAPILSGVPVDVFSPINLTENTRHYAATRGEEDGYVVISGFRENFIPATNVFEEFTVARFAHLSVRVRFSVSRTDDDFLRITPTSLYLSPEHVSSNVKFITDGVAIRGYFASDGTPRVQIQTGPYVQCDLALAEYEELRIRTGVKPNLGYMEFNSKNMDVSRSDLPVVGEALKRELRCTKFEPYIIPKVIDPQDGDVETHLLQREQDAPNDPTVPKPLGMILPQIATNPSVVYSVNLSSEHTTYAERVTKFVKDEDFVVPDKYKAFRNEFLQLLIDEKSVGCLAPDDQWAVLDRQTRPTQRLGFEETMNNVLEFKDLVDQSFQKGEVYPEFKAPRNIINPDHQKRVYTNSIITPLNAYLKQTTLRLKYAFGDSNYLQECFNRIDQADSGLGKFETDGEKLDANISYFFRELEEMLLMRAFAPHYHDSIREIHESQYSCKFPRTRKGTRANLRFSRRSGEGGTSLFNTIDMMFVPFCAMRLHGHSARDSFKMIGLHGGDDGLMVQYVSLELLKQTGDELGLPLKIKSVESDKPYSFLGITKLGAHIDLYVPDASRFIYKIGYSHVKNVPLNEVLYRKCEPYVLMYPNVPLVGNLCRAVLRILKRQGFKVDSKYDSMCQSGAGYVMSMLAGSQLPGPESEEEVGLYEAYICEQLGISLGMLRHVNAQYDLAEDFSQFPTGYVTCQLNTIVSCKYEALFRDLYIPGQGPVNLTIEIPNLSREKLHTQAPDNGKEEEQRIETKVVAKESGAPSIESAPGGDKIPDEASEASSKEQRKWTKVHKRSRAVVFKSGPGSS